MYERNEEDQFSPIELDDYEVKPLVREADNRGFIYLLEDSAFPGYVKIGRTICMKKRLAQYNADRPYPTATLLAITGEFVNAPLVEKKILEHLYSKTSPTTFSREWFKAEHKQLCLTLMDETESVFTLTLPS